jgi:uncharacterized protein (DUF1800 family)
MVTLKMVKKHMNRDMKSAIAVTRFGIGAMPGEIEAVKSGPQSYLLAQLRDPERALINDPELTSSLQSVQDYHGSSKEIGKLKKMADAEEAAMVRKMRNRAAVDHFRNDIAARMAHAMTTDHSFLERWIRFWGNHFTVSAKQARMYGLVGPFEREVIRSYALGEFTDMVLVSSFHPAMQVYLDNYRSIGPNSRSGRANKRGLNENLAREILELHTLGVGAYTQADIESFAKALTGWTIEIGPDKDAFGRVVFRERWHEPGAKTFMGRRYADLGPEQAAAMIADVSVHPATARHIANKLVTHFVSDQPQERDIDKLADVFMRTQGNLKSLAKAVVRLDSAWTSDQPKFKSPDDWVVSAGRVLGVEDTLGRNANSLMLALGQPVFRAPSPQGFPDVATDWIGADAIKKRLEWANRVARKVGNRMGALQFFDEALGPLVSSQTRQAVGRAESQAQGLTLALMSPEFQRR